MVRASLHSLARALTVQRKPAQSSWNLDCSKHKVDTGPGSAVGNQSDCRSRDSELDPGLVPYFCAD